MSQSLVKMYAHLIFSTKNRVHCLHSDIQPELYSYVGGILNNLKCYPVKIGGHTNHIHILCLQAKNITTIELLSEIKINSSKWIKTKDPIFKNFHWQDGYGAFSVSPSKVEIVTKYIENQKEHHKIVTYEDEVMAFLKEYQIEYDERYLWD